MLPSKVDLTNPTQKFFAAILLAAGIGLVWWMLPSLIWFFEHLIYLGVLVLCVAFVAINYKVLWQTFLNLSWKSTKWLISQDKLGYMYRYHDYLLKKLSDLKQNVENVGSARVRLSRSIEACKQTLSDNLKKASAYKDRPNSGLLIKQIAGIVAVDEAKLKNLGPQLVTITAQQKTLQELYDVWSADAETLKYTLDSKADEYATMKEISEAAGNAKEFLKGNTGEAKLYKESLRQIEASVTQYMSNIESFEREALPLLNKASADASLSEAEGMKLIEEFKNNQLKTQLA